MSPDEFEEWVFARPPEDINHYELLDGEIVVSPPAGWPHGRVGSRLQVLLGGFVEQKQLGLVFDSSQGFVLTSGDTVEPDHAFVSNERWAAAPEPVEGKFLRIVPDLLVEVLSPGNATRDRKQKKRIYEKNGVREYWIVDSKKRVVSVFRAIDGAYVEAEAFVEGMTFESGVITGLSVDVRSIFA
jgi:Uma2 family endonuclease